MKLGWKKFSITFACLIAVLPIEAAFGQVNFRPDVVTSLKPDKGGFWGIWTNVKYCPEGSWASGFGQRVEPQQGSGDDTALNSVALICTNKDGVQLGEDVTPHRGYWGNWSYRWCPPRTHMTHFKLKHELERTPADNTTANAVSFWCSNGMEIRARNEGVWGTWSSWTGYDISTNRAICGLSQRMSSMQGQGDDTALNNIEIYWCRR